MKGSVKVAYWDNGAGPPPRLVGEIRGTPTIKFIYPNKKNKRTTNKRKIVLDYNGERKLDAMLAYASSQMPNHLTRINGDADYAKFVDKADGFGLPKMLLFTKESASTPPAKALSTELRRRALVGEVRTTKPNGGLVAKFGLESWLSDKSAERTVVVALKDDGKPAQMNKDGKPAKFSLGRATAFASKFALQKPYFEDEVALERVRQRDAAAAPGGDKAEL